jgi:hypothetical protein
LQTLQLVPEWDLHRTMQLYSEVAPLSKFSSF